MKIVSVPSRNSFELLIIECPNNSLIFILLIREPSKLSKFKLLGVIYNIF